MNNTLHTQRLRNLSAQRGKFVSSNKGALNINLFDCVMVLFAVVKSGSALVCDGVSSRSLSTFPLGILPSFNPIASTFGLVNSKTIGSHQFMMRCLSMKPCQKQPSHHTMFQNARQDENKLWGITLVSCCLSSLKISFQHLGLDDMLLETGNEWVILMVPSHWISKRFKSWRQSMTSVTLASPVYLL